MSDEKPIFCGSGKKIEFVNGGHIIRLSISSRDVETMAQHLNDKGWVTVEVKENFDGKVTQSGFTHHCKIDTWQPKGPGKPTAPYKGPVSAGELTDEESDNIPF